MSGKRIDLDVTCMYDPWPLGNVPPRLVELKRTSGVGLNVRGMFSDAAGTYVAQWFVIDRSSVRSILSRDEKLFFGKQHPLHSN